MDAGNMAARAVLGGIESIIVLVDHGAASPPLLPVQQPHPTAII
jgi:hypothetical protein